MLVVKDAIQTHSHAAMSQVLQVCVCCRGEACRGSEVAHGLLQVQHVQQDVGQHQQQCKGQCAVLQGELY